GKAVHIADAQVDPEVTLANGDKTVKAQRAWRPACAGISIGVLVLTRSIVQPNVCLLDELARDEASHMPRCCRRPIASISVSVAASVPQDQGRRPIEPCSLPSRHARGHRSSEIAIRAGRSCRTVIFLKSARVPPLGLIPALTQGASPHPFLRRSADWS